jgi:hypothetical protein
MTLTRNAKRERLELTTSPELFELKVLVEAYDWHDVATLMASVDRALDPHQAAVSGERRWSVVANRLPADRAHELLEFVDQQETTDSQATQGSSAPTKQSA